MPDRVAVEDLSPKGGANVAGETRDKFLDDLRDDSEAKPLRAAAAAGSIFMSGLSGFLSEGATASQLSHLKYLNPGQWGNWQNDALGSVRYQLQHNADIGSMKVYGEQMVLDKIKLRGAAQGVAGAALGLGLAAAEDIFLFKNTPRGAASQLADVGGIPLASMLPVEKFVAALPIANPYARIACAIGGRALAIAGVHAVGRLIDSYYKEEQPVHNKNWRNWAH